MRTLPDKLTSIELATGTVLLDAGGFIVDPETWTREFAYYMADKEGVELTALHWQLIQYMRDSLAEHGVMVDARWVIKHLAKIQTITKSEAHKLLYVLFPYGYVKQACRIAGMKQPRAWSTG